MKFERELNFRVNGDISTGKLTIGGLRKKPSTATLSECWACSWSLAKIHPQTAEICGEDPLDAFLNCVDFIRLLIEKHKSLGYEVWWCEKGDSGGLTPALPKPDVGKRSQKRVRS